MKRYSIVLIIICLIFSGCKKDKEPVVETLKIDYPKAENSLFNVLSDSLTQIIGGENIVLRLICPKALRSKLLSSHLRDIPLLVLGFSRWKIMGGQLLVLTRRIQIYRQKVPDKQFQLAL